LTRIGKWHILAASLIKNCTVQNRDGSENSKKQNTKKPRGRVCTGDALSGVFLRTAERNAAGKEADAVRFGYISDQAGVNSWPRLQKSVQNQVDLNATNRSRKSEVSSAPLGRCLSGGIFFARYGPRRAETVAYLGEKCRS
jgi:hypothetical protein